MNEKEISPEEISPEKMEMIQTVLLQLVNSPTIRKLGFARTKNLLERQLLLSALERNGDDPVQAAHDLQMHPSLMRYHLRYTLGRITEKKKVASVTRLDRQRKLGF